MATLTTPPGWYTDPLARHDYRYWDGSTWTPGVSDHGVTGTDPPEAPPSLEPSASRSPADAAGQASQGEPGRAPAYRVVAVSRGRAAAIQVASAGIAMAFLFEIVASVVLANQVSSFAGPSRSTLGWAAWLYDFDALRIMYTYPPLGLWLALLLAIIFLSLITIAPLQALKKAGQRAPWRWSAPAERATLARGLTELGCAQTMFRARGRRGWLVASVLASSGVVLISGYTLVAKPALLVTSGAFESTTVSEAGLGPVVCLVAGVLAVACALLAWPWTAERHVLVYADGTMHPDEGPGSAQPLGGPAFVGSTAPGGEQPTASAASTHPRRWLLPAVLIGTVVALLASMLVWSPWSDESAPTTVTASAPSPLGLKAGPVTLSTITLRWAPAATAPLPDRYLILSDGEEIASVPGTSTAYRLTGLAPATQYAVSVVADWGDRRSLPSSVLSVTTHTPALAAARLSGTWDVHLKVTKAPSGSSATIGEKTTEAWTFTPKCKAGPCAVVVSGELWSHPFTATLTRSGAVYTGTGQAHITHCGSFPLQSTNVRNTVTLRLTVKKAKADGQTWSASSLVGTMVLASPYTRAGIYYCPAQSITSSLAATH